MKEDFNSLLENLKKCEICKEKFEKYFTFFVEYYKI